MNNDYLLRWMVTASLEPFPLTTVARCISADIAGKLKDALEESNPDWRVTIIEDKGTVD